MVEAALSDVEAFWARTFEDLYGSVYEPISGGFWPYGPGTEQPPCGNPPPTYDQIAGNAFYCPGDDLIAWDNAQLIPGLYDEYGGFTIGIVFAHESRTRSSRGAEQGPTVRSSSRPTASPARGPRRGAGQLRVLRADAGRPRQGGRGFLELRDGVGGARGPAAHGTGFDRIGSFVDGYEQGVERCAD